MSEKSCFFHFFLMLCAAFSIISVLYKMLISIHIILKIKNLKKMKNNILKLFLKNENWTFIFVHISKLKKSFKKIKRFSVFFQPPKNAFLVFQSTKYLFFGDALEYFWNYLIFKKMRKCKAYSCDAKWQLLLPLHK